MKNLIKIKKSEKDIENLTAPKKNKKLKKRSQSIQKKKIDPLQKKDASDRVEGLDNIQERNANPKSRQKKIQKKKHNSHTLSYFKKTPPTKMLMESQTWESAFSQIAVAREEKEESSNLTNDKWKASSRQKKALIQKKTKLKPPSLFLQQFSSVDSIFRNAERERQKKRRYRFFRIQEFSQEYHQEADIQNILRLSAQKVEQAIRKNAIQSAVFLILLIFSVLPLMSVPFLGVLVGAAGGDINLSFAGRGAITEDVDLEGIFYQIGNPYTKAGYRGQCTWYVWGRVREALGIELPSNMGNAGDWIEYAKNDPRFIIGDEPRPGAIIVTKGDAFGHVAFVESYDPKTKTAIITEGNVGNPMTGTDQMVDYAREHYADLFYRSEWKKRSSRWNALVLGFIYLDNFEPIDPPKP